MKNFNANTIENAIGYRFSNKDLLKQAFTRKSYTVEMDQGENNEVLEFLGDKVLDLIVTKKLIEQTTQIVSVNMMLIDPTLTPHDASLICYMDEDALSQARAEVVNKKSLAGCINVLGLHDLNVYCYGPNKYFASVHIELDADMDSLLAHEIVDNIEREFLNNTNIVLTGHHDPIVTNDAELNKMRKKIKKLVAEINKDFLMHDFRMVKGPTKTNLIFEIAVPFDNKLGDNEIISVLTEKITDINKNYTPVIMIEKQMIV